MPSTKNCSPTKLAKMVSKSSGLRLMWKPSNHKDFPWTGIVFGAPILGIWYWCTDQHIVQRVLAARNIQEARRGTIFAGYLKILPVFIFVLPGIIAAALYQDVRAGQTDSAYPILVTRLLPIGFKGLVLAGMLAALMSSLASAFNSCSTLLTWDVYRKWRPNATEARLVFVGRVTTVILVFFGLAWIPAALAQENTEFPIDIDGHPERAHVLVKAPHDPDGIRLRS